MEDGLKLLKDYTHQKHTEQLKMNNALGTLLDTTRLGKIYNESWENETWLRRNQVPYESLTYLLDAYSCLPHRPDMGFTFLWMSINNTYKKVFLKSSVIKNANDDNCIEQTLKELEGRLNHLVEYKGNQYSILKIIKMYVEKMPLKIYRFVANYILRGKTIESAGFPYKYHIRSYGTFKKHFRTLEGKIANTYFSGFSAICSPKMASDNSKVELQIDQNDEMKREKSRTIPNSLAKKLKILLQTRTVNIYKDIVKEDATTERVVVETLRIDNDYEFLNFVFRIILYSIRNNSFHGNIASRLNSKHVVGGSVNSSNYVFLLGHLFLTLFMYCSGELDIQDLAINLENLDLLDNPEQKDVPLQV